MFKRYLASEFRNLLKSEIARVGHVIKVRAVIPFENIMSPRLPKSKRARGFATSSTFWCNSGVCVKIAIMIWNSE